MGTGANCFPEVAQDAAVYFDPGDVDSIAQALNQVLDSSDMQLALIESGKRQLNRFSWAKTAHETRSVYEYAVRMCR